MVYNFTYAYVHTAVKSIFDPEIPNNDGSVAPIRLLAPEGSMVNCRFPAAVAARMQIGHFLTEIVYRALTAALPGRVIAGSGGTPATMMENKLNPAPAPLFACGALHLRRDTKLALVADQPVPLTPLEYNLLIYLFRHQTRAVSPEELLEAVWACPEGGTVNQVKCCIKRLRRKLAVDEDTPQYIHTIRGFGYRLCEPEELPPPPT